VVKRRYSRVQTEGIRVPDLIVVDGGKGQLSSAYRELQTLGMVQQPIIGLAKQREEIFRPLDSHPLILPHESGAIRLLQRIRDEAHRFANGYHQLLMKQRISESILDDCPGVSESRKLVLQRAFGSIEKLRKASAEEISQVEGIGQKLAENIVHFFEKMKNYSAEPQEENVYVLQTSVPPLESLDREV
jgi:excinuclease ABC subunit C